MSESSENMNSSGSMETTKSMGDAKANKHGKEASEELNEQHGMGMASGMSMSATQLQTAFQAALATNPKLRFGQFVAATTIAQNLAMSNPNITTNAILQGLASGKNLSQTLQGLGLSATQAKTALRTAHETVEDIVEQHDDMATNNAMGTNNPMGMPVAGKASKHAEEAAEEMNEQHGMGMANVMSMSATQLQSAFQAALATNPKLKFGQFVAATTIAQNLAMSNPNITTNAILQGLASGKSISQTLQGLGLSATQAKTALRTAHETVEDIVEHDDDMATNNAMGTNNPMGMPVAGKASKHAEEAAEEMNEQHG
ncbi:MAG: hypothetical protein J2P21_25795, partial [Chloracidobacterium sp.]|nr:hypothetical protein [Chloracidobacterium sp.]